MSINKTSGKGHDGYGGTRIPNKAFDALKARFPDWKWPADQIVESKEERIFMRPNKKEDLRKVRVSRGAEGNDKGGDWEGHFHGFADAPIIAGGGQGFIAKTVALIEDCEGYVYQIQMNGFRFLNTI